MTKSPLIIVILEDDAAHAEAIRRAFENSGMDVEISVAGTLKEYREVIAHLAPDVALLDMVLPDGRAMELLSAPAEAGPFPILIMTSFGNEQVAVEALKSGALDYLVKSPEAFAAMPKTVSRVLREWNLLQARRQAEEELRSAKEELEIRVRERTKELEQAYADLKRESEERLAAVHDLREKEQLLLQQNRLAAMGEMIANIAHQWRQPLNLLGLLIQELPILASKGLLTEETIRETKVKGMQLITRMSQTIDDFRNFFRPDKGTVVFQVNEVVRSTTSLLQVGLEQQSVVVEIVQEETIEAEGYPNELSQVILNIVMNARDAFRDHPVDKPKIVITIFMASGRPNITISDNAGGIPDQILDRIFDPYFTTKGPDQGTGIGLFMSKIIIEKNMNGCLSVRNTEEGAEFRIVL